MSVKGQFVRGDFRTMPAGIIGGRLQEKVNARWSNHFQSEL